MKNFKICLCTIGKKENLYALEFVNHYKNLGYNHIFIYDNNDINDERFEEVIDKHIKTNYVSIINFRGFIGRRGENPHFYAYYDCYKKNNKIYKWLSFFDFDEYLRFKTPNETIQNFLYKKRFNKCICIKINWLMYSDNNLLYYQNKSLNQRFLTPIYDDPRNNVIKSTVRGNLKINYWENMRNPHTTSNNDYISCSSSGKIVKSTDFFVIPPDFELAFLNHYATKTIEEYCLKLKRGWADIKFQLNNQTLKEKFDYFFLKNKKTKEKLLYFKNMFNITFQP